MANVTYHRPQSIREYTELMQAHRKTATIIAGGTNLIPDMRIGTKSPQVLVDICGLEELAGITQHKGATVIGAATTISELADDPLISKQYAILSKAAGEIGNHLTRNRATIGGNLAHASPCADTAPPLLALEAAVHTIDAEGKKRRIPLENFFMGYRLTQLDRGEIISAIELPPPVTAARGGHTKLGLRKASAISVTSVALMLQKEDQRIVKVRIAFGSVAPQPIRAYNLEAFLTDKAVNAETLAECERLLESEIEPISDIRGSQRYRRAATGAILKRNLVQAWS